jgi:protoporphyrinogen oxidase
MPLLDRRSRIAILGAGPTGLGAAYRLSELGFDNYQIFEQEGHPGGLAASFQDEQGFTWDIGGHVQFSHYSYFDALMEKLLGQEWLWHERESWVRILGRFVPYPFQNNIRFLPPAEMWECLRGLIRARRDHPGAPPANFDEWILQSFGEGIARIFMRPYNFKVWAHPPAEMSFHWIGDRVATVDLERVVRNILEQKDDRGWGPNNQFRFPVRGGTGEIWRRLAATLPQNRLTFHKTAVRVDLRDKKIEFSDGTHADYDFLISSIPLNVLVALLDWPELETAAKQLQYSSTHVVGIGLRGAPPPSLTTKCWMYFPEDDAPFYRATVFSNYSPNNVPDITRYWSLMVEVSESDHKPVDPQRLLDEVVAGLQATHLVADRDSIVSLWHYRAGHGYPIPSLGRDQALQAILPALEQRNIFSRGRFGAWKYEVSNQDHSLMQGVELVNRLAADEEEITLNRPNDANRTRR